VSVRVKEVGGGTLRGASCDVPPAGWSCSRQRGHDGPCAASPVKTPATSPLREPAGPANGERTGAPFDWTRDGQGRPGAYVQIDLGGAPPLAPFDSGYAPSSLLRSRFDDRAFCVFCGVGVGFDEDGCCTQCGNAVRGVRELRALLASAGLTLIPTADLEDLRKQVADAIGHAGEDWRCG
jgi:hypothetical protein